MYAKHEQPFTGLGNTKGLSIKLWFRDIVVKLFKSLLQLVVAMPVLHLYNIFNHNPSWLESLSKTHNFQSCFSTSFTANALALCFGVIGAFGRGQYQVDLAQFGVQRLNVQIEDVCLARYACTEVAVEGVNRRPPDIEGRHNLDASLARAITAAARAAEKVDCPYSYR